MTICVYRHIIIITVRFWTYIGVEFRYLCCTFVVRRFYIVIVVLIVVLYAPIRFWPVHAGLIRFRPVWSRFWAVVVRVHVVCIRVNDDWVLKLCVCLVFERFVWECADDLYKVTCCEIFVLLRRILNYYCQYCLCLEYISFVQLLQNKYTYLYN